MGACGVGGKAGGQGVGLGLLFFGAGAALRGLSALPGNALPGNALPGGALPFYRRTFRWRWSMRVRTEKRSREATPGSGVVPQALTVVPLLAMELTP